MSRLTEDRMRTIESALHKAGAILPCPRCGRPELTLLDGYTVEHVQLQLRNLVISGDNRLSCIATICDHCGFLAQHLLDVLDGES